MRISACLVIGDLLLAGCGGRRDRSPGADGAVRFDNLTAAYTGDTACAQCHEDEWGRYQTHAMARSFHALTPETAVEDFEAGPVYDERSRYWYRAFREGERYFQEEYRLDERGRRTHSLVLPVDYVMGSGNAARSYFSDEGGWLFQMPLTWYAQRSRWGMSPGYERANKRFDRLVPERCMACHDAYPEAVPHTEGKFARLPLGIGCERCHGPGSAHVAARLRDPDARGVDPTIVNPAHLEPALQLDVCGQCHLNATVSILRDGRSAFDFRPSERLSSHVALFAATDASQRDGISVISHADRLMQSRCFTGTAAAGRSMTCTTCHDPHETFRVAGPEYFDGACRSCHERAALGARFTSAEDRGLHRDGGRCASCHMPFVAAGEAPHTAFTDHRVRVVRAGTDDAPLPGGSSGLEPVFDRDRAGPDAERYAAIAAVVAARQRSDSTQYEEGIRRLARWLARNPRDGEARFLAGFALVALGRVDEALTHLEAAVEAGPAVPERLNALAEAYAATGGEPARTERLYRRALDVQPALATVRVNLGRFLQARSRVDEALSEYRAAAHEMPRLREAAFNEGTALAARGDRDGAKAALDRAIHLDPDYGKALANRGLIALAEGDRSGGRALLERAAIAAPGDPVVLGNLGAFYVEEDLLDRAIPLLRRAVAFRPDHFDALVNLALALVSVDRPEEARPLVERALRLRPGDPLARRILEAL